MVPHTAGEMRVVVVRSGGFAGIRQQWQLDGGGDADLLALITACPWDAIRPDPGSADRFVWRIEARMPWGTHSASVAERELVGPWRALVDRVQETGSRG